MLAISERESPCRARISPSSLGLVTVRTPSSLVTSMGGGTSSERTPLGPLTVTPRPSMVTSTPPGITTGIRPIRDISASLPDVGEDFPAYSPLVRLLVRHQARGGGDDRDAEPAEHPRQVVLPRVHPQARLGHPLEPGDRALAGGPELEHDHEVLADLGVLPAPGCAVALLLQDFRDVHLDLGVRHG